MAITIRRNNFGTLIIYMETEIVYSFIYLGSIVKHENYEITAIIGRILMANTAYFSIIHQGQYIGKIK